MAVPVVAATREDLPAIADLLKVSQEGYRAHVVAEETLFEGSPAGSPTAWLVRQGDGIVGVCACVPGYLRILAVHPGHRRQGLGTALLERAVEHSARAKRLRTLAEPGNYLAPGIIASDAETRRWLEKRGFRAISENRNLTIDLERALGRDAPTLAAGYRVTTADDDSLIATIADRYGAAWAHEAARAQSIGGLYACHTEDGELAGFAAHDGNNTGLGWFGPAGTEPAHQRRGLGRVLLWKCLQGVKARGHDVCEIAWIGPQPFYERAVGVDDVREFVVYEKTW